MIRIVKLTIKEECIELFHHFFVQHHEIIKKSNSPYQNGGNKNVDDFSNKNENR
jgi:hypothetical protein